MKKGFSLVELLVVMVIIALLIGLLLPALARAKEEARKTQCRSNLRQIGLAMMVYAGDNGGWTPEIGGVLSGRNSDGMGFYPSARTSCDDYGLMYSFEPPCGSNLTMGQPQHWLCTKAAPSRPVGLGLLWAAGYLTAKGALVLYCPSNQSGPGARELRNDRMRRYDGDEPFWTSRGTIVRGDADRFGDWEVPFHSPPTCWDGSANQSGGVCIVLSNYDMRMHKEFFKRGVTNFTLVGYGSRATALPTAIKVEQVGNCALVADTLEMAIGAEPEDIFGPVRPPAPERYWLAENYIVRNHVNAWNILFVDGSVKTCVDGSKTIFRAVVDRWVMNVPSGGDGPSEPLTHFVDTDGNGAIDDWELDAYVWTPFLDTAYGAD